MYRLYVTLIPFFNNVEIVDFRSAYNVLSNVYDLSRLRALVYRLWVCS